MLEYVRMNPVFSATNTRPLGAIAMSCGFPTPGSTVVSAKSAGRVTAEAPAVSATKRQATDVANAKARLTIRGPLGAIVLHEFVRRAKRARVRIRSPG